MIAAKKLLLSSGPRLDPDAKALIRRMSPRPSIPRQKLINATVVRLKDAGIWSALDNLWIMAAHNEQAALLNWIAPFGGLSAGGGLHVPDSGMQFSASQRATGTLGATSGGVKHAAASAAAFSWFNITGSRNVTPLTAGTIGNGTIIQQTDTSSPFGLQLSQGHLFAYPAVTGENLLHMTRTGTGSGATWANGVARQGLSSSGATTMSSRAITIGAMPGQFAGGNPMSVRAAGIGSAFSNQVVFYNIIRDYLLAVGAVS